MPELKKIFIKADPWSSLKAYTDARIALGKTGTAIPLQASLSFNLAHAHARDAVYSLVNKDLIVQGLSEMDQSYFILHSKAADRNKYLQRPDLGRQLNTNSVKQLTAFQSTGFDVCITIADGLSATAINAHAMPLLRLLIAFLRQHKYRIAPVCVVEQGRVAIGDETGSILKAELSVILIGERPGLTSHDSLGVYFTYGPAPGTTDEKRNCISNIKPGGLPYNTAAEKILYLVKESLRLKLSGVQLKDTMGFLHD